MESQKETNGQTSEPRRHLGQKVERVGSSIQSLASRESVDELRDMLDLPRRMSQSPYGMIGVALGVGYLLGGGLFSSTTRRVLHVGLRFGVQVAAISLLKEQFGLLTRGASNGNHNSTNQGENA
jgi:hypothetical protein